MRLKKDIISSCELTFFEKSTLMIRISIQVQEPWGVNERLNFQHGEVQCTITRTWFFCK